MTKGFRDNYFQGVTIKGYKSDMVRAIITIKITTAFKGRGVFLFEKE